MRKGAITIATTIATMSSLSMSLPALGTPGFVGEPFDVSSSPAGALLPPSVSASDDGFVVAWPDASFGTIFARLLDRDGASRGPVFGVNATPMSEAYSPSIALQRDGSFAVEWTGTTADTREGVWVRGFDPAGSPEDEERLLYAPAPFLFSVRSLLFTRPSGGFTSAWSSGIPKRLLEFRLLGPDLIATSDVVSVGSGALGATYFDAVAATADDGETLFVWNDQANGLYAQLFGPSGLPRGAAAPLGSVAEPFLPAPALAADPRGGFTVAWVVNQSIMLGHLESPAAGVTWVRELVSDRLGSIGPDYPAVAHAGDGSMLVVWLGRDVGGRFGVIGERYDAVGAATASRFQVSDPNRSASAPSVTATSDGRFLVSWIDIAASSTSVRARVLSPCGDGRLDRGEECDDGNHHDGDCCSAACTVESRREQCWELTGRTMLRATARGTLRGARVRCAGRCQTSSRAFLMLDEMAGTYVSPSGETSCSDGRWVSVLDEIGSATRTRGRLRLFAENVNALQESLAGCIEATTLQRIRWSLRTSADGRSIRGRQTTALRMADEVPVTIRSRTTFVGEPLSAGTRLPLPAPRRRPPLCETGLRLRCRARR